jgi:hypothetical protein
METLPRGNIFKMNFRWIIHTLPREEILTPDSSLQEAQEFDLESQKSLTKGFKSKNLKQKQEPEVMNQTIYLLEETGWTPMMMRVNISSCNNSGTARATSTPLVYMGSSSHNKARLSLIQWTARLSQGHLQVVRTHCLVWLGAAEHIYIYIYTNKKHLHRLVIVLVSSVHFMLQVQAWELNRNFTLPLRWIHDQAISTRQCVYLSFLNSVTSSRDEDQFRILRSQRMNMAIWKIPCVQVSNEHHIRGKGQLERLI